MRTKKDKNTRTIHVTVCCVNQKTGENWVECFDLEEEFQADVVVVCEHIKARGTLPMGAKAAYYRLLFDEDRCGCGHFIRFEDHADCSCQVILDCLGWGEDLSFWGPMDF